MHSPAAHPPIGASAAMSETQDLRAAGDRIELLLEEFAVTADRASAEKLNEVVRLVTTLYGAGIERILEIVSGLEGIDADAFAARLTEDELVASLLVVHGLHPHDLAARIQHALDDVRPYLGSHGGDVELLGVDEDEGVVRLKMLGSCDGCPSSSVTLKLAVEGAITEAAPEIVRIEVEGTNGAASESLPGDTPVRLTRKPDTIDTDDRWVPVYGLNRLAHGRLEALEIEHEPLVCCRVGRDLYAYRDCCPVCDARLRDGSLDGEVIRCGACGAAFDARRAGRSLDGTGDHLEPLPLLDQGGTVKIALPVGADA